MLNGCEVIVGFEGDGARALELVERELLALGYERKKLEADKLVMKFSGKLITADPNKMRHQVTVLPKAGALCFQFGTGVVASYWTDKDRDWAEERANQVVRAVQSGS
ncbi:MAG: hypothetical protein R3B07_33845 [Polyangiaceae bacterium]